jgi:membrane associated rhomboid family serine protease
VSCTRCERPICPDCLRPASVGFQCPDCVAAGKATTREAHGPYGGQLVQRTGLVTVVLAVLNIAAFLVTAATSPGGFTQNTGSVVFTKLELVPARVAVFGEYWRLIGAAFLHIGLLHLVVNMLALGFVGPALERVFGHWRFTALYLLSALGGSVSVYLFAVPFLPVAGASGAIYGLFAATVIVLRKLGLDSRAMIVTIAVNFAISVTVPGISLLGHLGGFVAGGLTALALVHAPRGPSRTSMQILAVGLILAVLVGLVVYRTHALVG